MNKLISFATPEYRPAAERLMLSGKSYFDETRIYKPHDIDAEFHRAHKHFQFRRGYGYWLWKPYFILKTLMEMGTDDFLFYGDSQYVFVADPQPLFDAAKSNDGICLFHQKREGHQNLTWTRRDTFQLMGADEPKYWYGDNLNASASVWTKIDESINFLNLWLAYCQRFEVIADGPSRDQELAGFKDNRQDQSVLSILAIREELKTFRDSSQWGVGYQCPNSPYGQIINCDRRIKAPPWTRRPQMSSIIEVSATATCPLRCAYCPQDKLGEAYRGPKELTLEMFERCLDNLVPGDAVYFAGFTEACLAPDFMGMLELTLKRYHRCRLYTTGRGLDLDEAKTIAAEKRIEMIVLHLPDTFGHLSNSKNNVSILDALSKHHNAHVMAMDKIPHKDIQSIWDRLPQNMGTMHDRAGNVTAVPVRHIEHKGAIKCGVAPQLDHPVLLPSGELSLCCQDYGLRHIVGNLATTPLSDILRAKPIEDIMALQRSGGEVLCKHCVCAVPV